MNFSGDLMANAKIFKPLPMTVTADSTASGFDPAFMANDHQGVVWQSPASGSAHYVQVDLGADVPFDMAALFGLANINATAVLTINIGTEAQGPSFAGGSWNSGPLSVFAGTAMLVNGKGVAYWEAPAVAGPPAAARYIRFGFSNLTAGAAIQVGRIAVGKNLVLGRNYAFGGAHGIRDFSTVSFSSRAVLLRKSAPKLRAIGLTFTAATRAEAEDGILPLLEQAGLGSPIVLVRDPAVHANRQRRIYFGLLEGDLGLIHRNAVAWQWSANLVSLF